MCNPNSSVANRRFRLAQFQAGGKTNLLTQKLVGSLMAVPPTLGSNKDNNIRTSRISSSISSSIDRSDYSIVTKSREGDGDTVNVDYPPSYEGVYHERSTSFSFPTSPPIAGYLSGSASSHFFQQPEFEVSAPLPVTSTPNNVRKQKERRRRKPQQPGLTAKNQERHFVQHNYHDHALDEEEEESSDESQQHRRRGGVSVSFPLKLHSVLEQVELDGFANVISWQPHGRCFCIHKPKEFTDVVMPRYFRQTKLTSFQRQLNLYGFQRLTRGNDSGGYYHELFLRYKAFLCKRMIRTKVKGTKFKAASSPEHEPNFYHLPPVVVTPHSSDCDHSENDDCSSGHDSHSKGSSEPITIENQPFQQPLLYHYNHAPYPNYATAQPHDPPKSAMVNKLALKIFGSDLLEMPPSPQVSAHVSIGSPIMANASRGYVAAPVISTAPSISLAPSNEFLDQAIDDLFLENPQAANEVMDFVTAWDEEFDKGQVTNDLELGNLLDKILED